MAHDVFISYSSKDKRLAYSICARLEEHGIRCWMAPRDILPGQNYAEAIIKAINSCKVFVFFWTANANTSGHILNEIDQAFNQGNTIIPFRIEEVVPTNSLRYYISRAHWLEAFSSPLDESIESLAGTILSYLGARGKRSPPLSLRRPQRRNLPKSRRKNPRLHPHIWGQDPRPRSRLRPSSSTPRRRALRRPQRRNLP